MNLNLKKKALLLSSGAVFITLNPKVYLYILQQSYNLVVLGLCPFNRFLAVSVLPLANNNNSHAINIQSMLYARLPHDRTYSLQNVQLVNLTVP